MVVEKNWRKFMLVFVVGVLLGFSPFLVAKINEKPPEPADNIVISSKADLIYFIAWQEALHAIRNARVLEQITQRPLKIRLSDSNKKSTLGPDMIVLARYLREENRIIMYREPFSHREAGNPYKDIVFTYLHEIGHAYYWSEAGDIRQSYGQLILSNLTIEESPDEIAKVIFEFESIDPEKPDKVGALFIARAVDEDFATSFALYFMDSATLERLYPKRFSWFNQNLSPTP